MYVADETIWRVLLRVLCVCLFCVCVVVKFVCVVVSFVCVSVLCCVFGLCCESVVGVLFVIVWRVHGVCGVHGYVVCSGKANDERKREHVVLNVFSNIKWVKSTGIHDP